MPKIRDRPASDRRTRPSSSHTGLIRTPQPESQPHYVKVAVVTAVIGGIVQLVVNHFDSLLIMLLPLLTYLLALVKHLVALLVNGVPPITRRQPPVQSIASLKNSPVPGYAF